MALALAYVPFFVYLCPRKGFFRPAKRHKRADITPAKTYLIRHKALCHKTKRYKPDLITWKLRHFLSNLLISSKSLSTLAPTA